METETKVAEVENTQVENNTTTTTPLVEETPEQINWKKFREAREVERKQKIEAEKRASEKEAEVQALKAAMESVLNRPSQTQPYASQDTQDPTDEERIKAQIEAIISAREKKGEEEKYRREQAEMPQKLTSSYADFNQICSESNIDYMEYHYPEVYNAFKQMPDGYDKWSSIYKAVKKLVPNTDSRKDQAKAEKNFTKPQAMSIPGKTQVGDSSPQMLDEKRKMDNWQRMQRVMKGGA